jgi:hypothetical protein
MKGKFKGILAVASFVLASLACQAVTGGGGGGVDPTPAAPPSTVIFSDDFSSTQWGIGTDADSSVEYANNALQMIVYTTNYFVWSTPNDQDYENVHMEATVLNNGTDSTTAFGFMCNMQPNDNDFYYLAVTPAGEYAIAKAAEGGSDVFLTNDDQWASSDQVVKNAPSYRIGADCGNGRLALYVDGRQIVSVFDSSYTSGGVGLFTWSGEEATATNISFDDFVMTELQ